MDDDTEHLFEGAQDARDTPHTVAPLRATMTGMDRPLLVDVPGLPPGVPYAYVAAPPAGSRLVFTAGACPLDAEGRVTAPGDVPTQARVVMDHLETALRAAGAQLDDVVRTTVYVASTHRDDLVAAWEVVAGRMGEPSPPSTLLGVTVLGWPGQLVEVEAVAAVAPIPASPVLPHRGPAAR